MRTGSFIVLIMAIAAVSFFPAPVTAYEVNAVAAYNNGVNLIASGNYSEAIQAFDQAVAREPSYFEAWNEKADALNRAKQYDDALASSDQALALNPDYVKSWINHGYILYNLGRYDEELQAYEHAIQIDPASAEAWFNKGYALGGMGRWDEALKSFDKVESLDPSYPNLQANQKIARKNLDASTPVYIKNAPLIIGIALVILLAGAWLYAVKKKY
jgi:tetratricopeptide (TPR) repeat protein